MGNIGEGGRINTGILGVKGLSGTRVGHIFNYKIRVQAGKNKVSKIFTISLGSIRGGGFPFKHIFFNLAGCTVKYGLLN